MAYRQTDAPEEAKDFIRWWIENNAPVWTVGRFPFLPARTSMWSDSVLRMNPLLEEVATLVMPHAVLPTWPRTNLYPQFHRIEGENLLGDALVSVLVGRQSPEEAAARLQRELERVFADSSVRP
jgi:multiple sugar transport system substrate-binding protein